MTTHDAGGVVVNDLALADRTVLRRLVLLGIPLAISLWEIFHPRPVGYREKPRPPGKVGQATG